MLLVLLQLDILDLNGNLRVLLLEFDLFLGQNFLPLVFDLLHIVLHSSRYLNLHGLGGIDLVYQLLLPSFIFSDEFLQALDLLQVLLVDLFQGTLVRIFEVLAEHVKLIEQLSGHLLLAEFGGI